MMALSVSLMLADCRSEATAEEVPPQTTKSGSTPAHPANAPLVVFLGDSLTAGYGLAADETFPSRVAALLRSEGKPIRVVNAGVSGDTTAGGLARLDWLLRQKPDVLVVCLGANDGLRGLPTETIEGHLTEIVDRARAAGAQILLLGVRLPPSYGEEYTARFAALYPALARREGVRLVPFLLDGIAGDPALNLADGIHPNARGQELLARNVLPELRRLIAELGTGSGLRRFDRQLTATRS
jgi:acyl-CoA thioesterase-1